jgi:hypothetical protein
MTMMMREQHRLLAPRKGTNFCSNGRSADDGRPF